MSNALTIREVTGELQTHSETIFSALPSHVRVESMIRAASSAFRRNPAILKCTKVSILTAITEAASNGLVTDGVLGHAYLVPFGDTCTLIAGYKGLMQMCRNTGGVRLFEAVIVREDDDFRYQRGTDPAIHHLPSHDADTDTWTHVYAIATMPDGSKQFEVMIYAEVMKHKDKYSKGKARKDSPWNTAEEEMSKKTVIRRLIKMLPVSSDIHRHAALDEEYEAGGYANHNSGKRVEKVTILDAVATPADPQSDDAEFQDASDAENAREIE